LRNLVAFLIGLASVAVQAQLQAQDNKPSDLVTADLGKDHFVAGKDVTVGRAVLKIFWPRVGRSFSMIRSEAMPLLQAVPCA